MKIYTNKQYYALVSVFTKQRKKINDLTQLLLIYRQRIKKLEHDIRLLKNINSPDIIFPNTDERGLGDSETPTNISEIYEL